MRPARQSASHQSKAKLARKGRLEGAVVGAEDEAEEGAEAKR